MTHHPTSDAKIAKTPVALALAFVGGLIGYSEHSDWKRNQTARLNDSGESSLRMPDVSRSGNLEELASPTLEIQPAKINEIVEEYNASRESWYKLRPKTYEIEVAFHREEISYLRRAMEKIEGALDRTQDAILAKKWHIAQLYQGELNGLMSEYREGVARYEDLHALLPAVVEYTSMLQDMGGSDERLRALYDQYAAVEKRFVLEGPKQCLYDEMRYVHRAMTKLMKGEGEIAKTDFGGKISQ
jgi:hypothetical protein